MFYRFLTVLVKIILYPLYRIKILGKENIVRGIALTREEEGLGIDIYLNVEFGARIPDLAWEVQSSVKEAVESVTGLAVQRVNIHVQGVNLQKELSQER